MPARASAARRGADRSNGAELERLVPGIRPRVAARAVRAGLRRHRRRRAPRRFSAQVPARRRDRRERVRGSHRARGRRWTMGHPAGRRLECVAPDCIVNAAGAWADEVARGCGVAPLGIAPKRRTMVQLRVGRSGLQDLPLVDDADGTFYFKGEGDRTSGSARTTKSRPSPCDAAPEEIDVATAIDRFEPVVDWPVERVERSWAGSGASRPTGCRFTDSTRTCRASSGAPGRAASASRPRPPRLRSAAPASPLLLERRQPDLPMGWCAHIDSRQHLLRRTRFRSDEASSESVMPPLVVGLGAGERVDAVVLGMAAVALDPMPFDPVRRGGVDQLLPQLGILDRLLVRRAPAVAPPVVDPAGDSVADVDAVGVELRPGTGASAPRAPWIAAISSMRLLVVSGSPPDELALLVAHAQQHAPSRPGPGLPRHAPSVNISTSGSSVTSGDELARQLEDHPLGRVVGHFLGDLEPRAKRVDHLAHQHLGRRGAGGEADRRGLAEPVPVDVARRARSAAPARPSARRPRRGAANCCCWARRSPASGRIRRRSP